MVSTPPDAPSVAKPATVDSHDALPPGTRLGEFEILGVLGVGGFGIVYLAQDHALERRVALKEYMPGALAGRSQGRMVSVRSGAHVETYALGLRSFVNEARLLARFNHPSLVKVYRFWEDNGTAYMVMPYLQGRNLREARRAMSAPPAEAWIRSVIEPVLDALDLLHREEVYHRDIAPDNILLPPGEPPVLLDFGAARRAIGDEPQTFTAILKPSYAPIEQYAEAAQLRQGPWTDLYALGAVAYYLLRGEPPAPATARAVQDDAPLLAPHENPAVSPQFLAAAEWMLAVRPADRPQSIAALREALGWHATVPAVAEREAGSGPAARDEGHGFAPTQPLDVDSPAPIAVEPTRTMSASPPWAPPSLPPRTRPEVTVMPAMATLESAGARASRRLVRMAAGGLGVFAIAAAAWTLGSHSVGSRAKTASAGAPSAGALARTPEAGTTLQPSAPPPSASQAARSSAVSVAAAHPRQKERAARSAPPVVETAGPRSPREACGARVFLAMAICMEEQCSKPQFKSHPQCERVRAIVERRHRSDGGG